MADSSLVRIRDLKFKQLLVFERVVALGSMHKAAVALHMSQPNVFKIIEQLERLLDVPLFERSSRGVVPTVFAERLLERVKPMLGDARAMGEDLVAIRQVERGHVEVGTLISASARLLPEAITLMKQRHPGVDITVREATNDVLFPMLAVGELDLIIGRLPDESMAGVDSYALYDESLVLVVRSGHPLVGRPDFALEALGAYPWILPITESPVRAQVEGFFLARGLPIPANRVESLSLLTNLGVLLRSDTVAMLPRAAAMPLIESGSLQTLPMGEVLRFGTVGYSLRAGRSPTPAGLTFARTLKEIAAGIAAER